MNAILPTPTMPVTDEETQIRASVGELVSASKDVAIMTHADLSAATDLVKAIKQRAKEAEDARTKITKPINDGLREINSRFKAMMQPLLDAEAEVKRKMVRFQEAEERRAREEAARKEAERQEQLRREQEEADRRRAAEAQEAADPTLDRPDMPQIEQEPVYVPPPAPIQPEIRKTTYGQSGAAFTAKKVWDYELVDLAQVPVQFLSLDSTKVNQAVKAGLRDIPGLRIFEKTVASVR